MASEELVQAVAELRERVAPELQPLVDALVDTPDSAVEDVWHQIVERSLSEA